MIGLAMIAASACADKAKDVSGQITKRSAPPAESPSATYTHKAAALRSDAHAFQDSVIQHKLYDSALYYLDRAIAADSLYVEAYSDKAGVYLELGLPVPALEVLRLAEKANPNEADAVMRQGFILEYLGNTDSAISRYQRSLEIHQGELTHNPGDPQTKLNIAFAHLFLHGKDFAWDEMRDLQKKHPDDNAIKVKAMVFENFDRDKFIREFADPKRRH